jgi:hypothetical protein
VGLWITCPAWGGGPYRFGMAIIESRRRRAAQSLAAQSLAATFAGILIVSVAGCAAAGAAPPTRSPSPPISTPPISTPPIAPVLATDEAALAAAEAAYSGYIETADQIITEGGMNPERIEQYATGPFADTEYDFYESIKQDGRRGTGTSTFSNMTLQRVKEDATAGKFVVVVTVCSDVTGTDMLDASGRSIVPADYDPTTPYWVGFFLADTSGTALKVADAGLAEQEGVCP